MKKITAKVHRIVSNNYVSEKNRGRNKNSDFHDEAVEESKKMQH